MALATVARAIYRDPLYAGYADPTDEHEQEQVLLAARETLLEAGIIATGFAPVGDPADEIFATAHGVGARFDRHRGAPARDGGPLRARLDEDEGDARVGL